MVSVLLGHIKITVSNLSVYTLCPSREQFYLRQQTVGRLAPTDPAPLVVCLCLLTCLCTYTNTTWKCGCGHKTTVQLLMSLAPVVNYSQLQFLKSKAKELFFSADVLTWNLHSLQGRSSCNGPEVGFVV